MKNRNRRSFQIIFFAGMVLGGGLTVSAVNVVLAKDGADWSNPKAWSGRAVPSEKDIVYIRSGRSVNVTSDVGASGRWILGDEGQAGMINISAGKITTISSASYVGRPKKNGASGYINLSGGCLQVGDSTGNQRLIVGVDNSSSRVTGVVTISGGSFVGRLVLGSEEEEDSGDKLRIKGSLPMVKSESETGVSLDVRASGTVEYIFDKQGIASMEFAGAVSFSPQAQIVVDGSAYAGSGQTFTLLKGAVLGKEPRISLTNVPAGSTCEWDTHKDIFTVTFGN